MCNRDPEDKGEFISVFDYRNVTLCLAPVRPSAATEMTKFGVVIIARPKDVLQKAACLRGRLFRYHVKRIHFTMQEFGFLSAILVRQNWKRATTTDSKVPPSFNLARFDLKKDCCLKLFTIKGCDHFSHSICSFYQLYFNWNNFSIKFVNWLFSMIAKSAFEISPKQLRTTWHHKAAVTS